jgi:ketosteroid isomerase-like protein
VLSQPGRLHDAAALNPSDETRAITAMTSAESTQATDMNCRIPQLFEAVDSRDAENLAPFLAEDVTLQFGSSESISGKQAFLASSREFSASIAAIHHEITELWNPEPDVAVLRVTYRRLDGRELTLPCCNVFRVRGGLVRDYRIYMDITPVYA